MKKSIFNLVALLIIFCFFTACTTVNQTGTVGQAQVYNVYYGRIVSIHEVKVENDGEKFLGGALGGLAGGVLGSAIGGGSGNTIATGLGVVGGVLGGTMLGGQINSKAMEIIIQTDEGKTISVIEKPKNPLGVGQRVKVMLGNNFSRVEPL